jgi:hypothetical protein
MRVFLRFWGDTAAAAVPAGRVTFGLNSDTYELIGYIRDALVILGIVAVGMYFLSYPDKFDAVLNWMLGRHQSGPAL